MIAKPIERPTFGKRPSAAENRPIVRAAKPAETVTPAPKTLDLDGGLHEQLAGVQAAAAMARNGRTMRLALGFAACGIAFALWAAPNMEETAYRMALAWQGDASDELTTASIERAAEPAKATGPRRYVLRRSVLQQPGEVCTIERGGETCADEPAN